MALELSVTKLRAEEASLRDALSKLSALNEGLAQDKLALNRLVAQVCRGLADPPALPPPPCSSETPWRRPQAQPTSPWTPPSLCLVLSLDSLCLLSRGLAEKKARRPCISSPVV